MQRPALTIDILTQHFMSMPINMSVTTVKLRKRLHTEYSFCKKDLNTMLYALYNGRIIYQRDTNSSPEWGYIQHKVSTDTTFVMVDCNNKPKCFKRACLLADKTQIVIGFACAEYNYYIPDECNPYCEFVKQGCPTKDWVKIIMCMKMSMLCERKKTSEKMNFILVSSDKGMKTIAYEFYRLYDIDVAVYDNWDELKLELE